MAASKRKELTLDQKIALLKNSERLSQRKLSATYGVSKTTVSNVLKRMAEYLEAYECNASPSKIYVDICLILKLHTLDIFNNWFDFDLMQILSWGVKFIWY